MCIYKKKISSITLSEIIYFEHVVAIQICTTLSTSIYLRVFSYFYHQIIATLF